ncbi:hypothetical protein tinsulaeT_21300 [Thalassotalea insulae]|uniref:Glycosyltransferase n=1 Tax=Thalassotalea insulae TaxID=2056778 RepID=A0ABQ6GW97_9GAMM|nr:glycosyltransferase [Thalassotalea insulae]GLX78790.1 hypothetical protein tinsulaeT_21300 [Thalassotalea insulae]
MQLDVVIEQRFYQTPDGNYWTENAFAYDFWTRYLTVFQQVNIVARVQQVKQGKENWHQVNGDRVEFCPLPYYLGLKSFLLTLPKLIHTLVAKRYQKRKVLFRIPGVLSLLYRVFAMPVKANYGAEVVGDPADTFSNNASSSRLRPVIRWAFIKMLRWQCRHASAISYVTKEALQRKYPANENAFQTHYSSIQLSDSDYFQRTSYSLSKAIKLLCIGNLSQPYKGCDFMLLSVAQMQQQGLNVHLSWIGGGQLLNSMRQLADDLKISQYVDFIGNVSEREQIHQYLDSHDIFILSSRQEGLPRVVIEAMARSLICVATNVGGVNELLAPEYIIERDNIAQLIEKITQISQMKQAQLMSLSLQNYHKALDYDDDILANRRLHMYQSLLR